MTTGGDCFLARDQRPTARRLDPGQHGPKPRRRRTSHRARSHRNHQEQSRLALASASCHPSEMKPIAPSWAKLSYIGMVWASGLSIGSFMTEPSHSTASWLLLITFVVMLPLCVFMLLRSDSN